MIDPSTFPDHHKVLLPIVGPVVLFLLAWLNYLREATRRKP